MALILNIDTATEYASIALSKEDVVLDISKNEDIKDHASWVHSAIHQMMSSCGYELSQLQAIAVTAGPGSYTGLRVGMATAKGLCFVLNIPLITENTLKVMARSAMESKGITRLKVSNTQPEARIQHTGLLLVPMIDARRMEVYTAIYNPGLEEVMPPLALILDATSFDDVQGGPIICFGSGSAKFRTIAPKDRFEFIELQNEAASLAHLAYEKFQKGEFADLAYAEPLYLKEFFSPAKK